MHKYQVLTPARTNKYFICAVKHFNVDAGKNEEKLSRSGGDSRRYIYTEDNLHQCSEVLILKASLPTARMWLLCDGDPHGLILHIFIQSQ